MENKIKIGIIGVGRMGITHYSIINSHSQVEIKCVADPSSLISNIFSKYIPDVQIYKDYNDLLKQSHLDAVLVCTPPGINYPILKLANDLGLHVFVEKPFCINTAQAKELDQLYSKKNLVNQVGYVNRFNDVFCKVKELIEERVIGDIIRFRSEMFSNTVSKPDEGNGWRMTRKDGGGAVYEMASHAIDLVNFIIGKPKKVVGAILNKIYSKNVEDVVSSTFILDHNISGTLYVNWSDTSYRKPSNKLEVFGTNGKLLADQYSLKIFLNKENPSFHFKEGWNTLNITDIFKPVPFYVRGNEFTRQLYHFIDLIQDRSIEPVCTFQDGIDSLEVIDGIFNDFETNQNIK
jgi:scyllo-inositol 2-dehydrogenase (NADP+)